MFAVESSWTAIFHVKCILRSEDGVYTKDMSCLIYLQMEHVQDGLCDVYIILVENDGR